MEVDQSGYDGCTVGTSCYNANRDDKETYMRENKQKKIIYEDIR